MSDIFVRLLNFNKSVFIPKSGNGDIASDYDSGVQTEEKSTEVKAAVSENAA